ncbi:MAG: hypothetical protein IPK95_02590 [Cellvibrionales bacterium]|nr:hypothetical protein [Cellvibrionales bacterium]
MSIQQQLCRGKFWLAGVALALFSSLSTAQTATTLLWDDNNPVNGSRLLSSRMLSAATISISLPRKRRRTAYGGLS